GHGRAVWVEGEAGIGKTALLIAALAAPARPHHLAWAVADEMSSHFPLAVVLEALDVTPSATDRRRAELGVRLREPSTGRGWNRTAPVDLLSVYVAELCATAPLVLVLDDLHRLDEAGLLFWDRLVAATGHLPLLLVGATRPAGPRGLLARPRRSVELAGGLVLRPGPLAEADVERLVGAAAGATGGPG
ncbi:ATP-binding protein, partial [Saccharothrix sp. MB29]|nr:ATP-binding protein [Saccharothrix sp. MB29]